MLLTNQHTYVIAYNTTCFVRSFLLCYVLGVSFSLVCNAEYLIENKMAASMRSHQCLYSHLFLVNSNSLFSPKGASTARQQCYNNTAVKDKSASESLILI